MIELKLKLDGKVKTFKQKEVSARAMRNYFKFYEKMEASMDEEGNSTLGELEMLDEMIVIVENTFTDPLVNFDNILDGLTASELTPTLQEVFEQVLDSGMGGKKTTPAK